jgi:probable F420-dependent oxidoreductase
VTAFELGRIGAWSHLDTLSAADVRAWARRVDELGFGTLWVPETVGREPLTLLGMLSGETSRIKLGTSIVSIWGHDAQSTRMAAMTLAEATAGRFVLGLGVSHPHLAAKLRGHAFDRPVTRMREFIGAYRSAIYKGPMTDAGEPPILVAALRERMTDLAATDSDGAFPYLVTADRVRWMRDRLDAAAPASRPSLAVTLPFAMEDRSRDAARAYLKPYLRTPTYHASWELQGFDASDWEQPGSDRLVDAMIVTGSADDARSRVDELVAAGADHVAVIPIGPDGSTEHLPALEALAP